MKKPSSGSRVIPAKHDEANSRRFSQFCERS